MLLGIVESFTSTSSAVLGAGGGVRFLLLTLAFGRRACSDDRSGAAPDFFLDLVGVAPRCSASRLIGNDYVFFAGYTVLQFVVLATAWNILGGYSGYVNFGSAAFFALGAYTTFFHKFFPLPIPVLIVFGAVVSGIVGSAWAT